jgi:CBS domain-containing protein
MAGIADLMVTETVTARADESVAAVAKRMCGNRVGAVLVMEGERLQGVFSERDLLSRVVAAGRSLEGTKVGEVATCDVVTIGVDAPLRSVLAIFREKQFRHLPVVRDGKALGILSIRDFLDYLVGGLEHYIDQLKYRRELAEGIDPYDHVGGSYAR